MLRLISCRKSSTAAQGATSTAASEDKTEKIVVLSFLDEAFIWVKRHCNPYSHKVRLTVSGILFEDVILLILRTLQLNGKPQDYVLSDAKGRLLEDYTDLVSAASDIITIVPKAVVWGEGKKVEPKAISNIWSGSDEDLDGYII